MSQPNVIWRLTSALIAIVETKELLAKCTQTNEEKVWIDYLFSAHGAPVELALIVDNNLTTHKYIADRIHEFFYKLNDYKAFTRPLNNPHNIKQIYKIYDALYTAILNFWVLEIKKLKKPPIEIQQNASKILNLKEGKGYPDMLSYFIKFLYTTLHLLLKV